MKLLYIDCQMGAAGDMLTGALLELLPDKAAFVEKLNGLGIPGVRFEAETAVRGWIAGTHMRVFVHEEEEHEHNHEHHHHSGLHEIGHIVEHLNIPEEVRRDVLAVYHLIAGAESRVHGKPVDQVHFHEVGALDAVADVTAVCLLLRELGAEKIVASPIHVGSGTVKCAHGILPVPAPATVLLLQGCPIYGGEVEGELCTPTGAALLKHFVSSFGPMPPMTPEAVGCGLGTKDFPDRANCVRVLLGQAGAMPADMVLELSCNVDDMSAEEIGFAMERLFEGGAKEVYTVAAGMKKSRPGTLLRVLCAPEQRERMVQLLFRYTSTIGVRETPARRYVLKRSAGCVRTSLGDVRYKRSHGYGVERLKYEYDDLARIAKANGMTLEAVRQLAERVRTAEVHHI